MNKLFIAAGVATSAVSLLAAVPAQAGTLTFGVEADASLQVEFSSLLAGRTVGGMTLPDSLQLAAEDVTGSFTVLDDPAQITDGTIELGSSLIAVLGDGTMLTSFLGDFGLTSGQAIQAADDMFTITGFSGSGVLTSEAPALASAPSSFDIFYKSGAPSLLLDGYDVGVAESCLSNTCQITGNVSFGVGLVLSEFVTFTGNLLANSTVTLSSEARGAIASLQQTAALMQTFGPTLGVATVGAEISATTQVLAANPNGTAVDVDVTGGLLTATATSGTQQEEIFRQSLVTAAPVVIEPPTGEDPPTTDDTVDEDNPVEPSTPDDSIETPLEPIVSVPIDNPDAQAVPEPGIMLGLLGTAALLKRGRKTA